MSGVYDIPPEPVRGHSLTAEWGIKIVRALKKMQPRSSDTVTVNITPSGTSYATTGRRGGTAKILRTLFVEQAGEDTVTVTPGMIRDIMPLIGAERLDAETAPELTITTSGVIYLEGTFDANGDPDGEDAFEILNAAVKPDNTLTKGSKTLATVTLTDGKITALNPMAWNLIEVQKCGPTTYLWGGFPDGV